MSNELNEIEEQVWEKAKDIVKDGNGNIWGKDVCGAWIKKSEYGNRHSKYGWEIDHIQAQANSGKDCISNLRPLHWKNNLLKSDGKLKQKARVTSQGSKNIWDGTDVEFVPGSDYPLD